MAIQVGASIDNAEGGAFNAACARPPVAAGGGPVLMAAGAKQAVAPLSDFGIPVIRVRVQIDYT